MISNDVTLSILFNVIDSNSDNRLSKAEFKSKLRGLQIGLEEQELDTLFYHFDLNQDGYISYNELVS